MFLAMQQHTRHTLGEVAFGKLSQLFVFRCMFGREFLLPLRLMYKVPVLCELLNTLGIPALSMYVPLCSSLVN